MGKFRIVFSFIIIGVLFFAIGCKKENSESTPPTRIKIAALYSETGSLAYLGLSSKAALEIAVEKVNSDFASGNIPFQFDLEIYNTEINPVVAYEAMQSIAARGCKLVIGPQTSAE